jgi:hypothetical protein
MEENPNILGAIEDPDDLRAYAQVQKSMGEVIPFDPMISEIETLDILSSNVQVHRSAVSGVHEYSLRETVVLN